MLPPLQSSREAYILLLRNRFAKPFNNIVKNIIKIENLSSVIDDSQNKNSDIRSVASSVSFKSLDLSLSADYPKLFAFILENFRSFAVQESCTPSYPCLYRVDSVCLRGHYRYDEFGMEYRRHRSSAWHSLSSFSEAESGMVEPFTSKIPGLIYFYFKLT
jgi:hypothetical protein